MYKRQHLIRTRTDIDAPAEHDHDHHDHDHTHHNKGLALWWIALPLFIGLLFPAKAFDGSAALVRGMNTTAPSTANTSAGGGEVTLPPEQRTVLDWVRSFNNQENPSEINGQPADVTGFVYQDIRLQPGQFMVARFSLACCVADASAIGMVVDWPEAKSLSINQWVRVRGTVKVGILDEKSVPMIEALSVEDVQAPAQPYLFP